MHFRIQDNVPAARLHDQPSLDAPFSAGTVLGTDILEKLSEAAEPGWCRVRVVTPDAPQREGFLRSMSLIEIQEAAPGEKIDKEAFFSQIAFAAQRFGSNRDYLYAVSVVESGVRNVQNKHSSAVGPFQFIPDTWDGLVAQHGAETGLTAADIGDPGSQAIFAAIMSSEAQTHLSKSLGQVPNGAELYCTHLLGIGAGAAALQVDRKTSIEAALRDFYRGKAVSAGLVDRIMAANPGILLGRTVEQALDEVDRRMSPGVDEASQLAGKLGFTIDKMPDGATLAEEPPWLVVAKQQLALNIAEDKRAGGSNPEIEKFFTATTLRAARDDTSWCGAFISWCMANSGNAKVVAGNRRSARAADWREWGFSFGKPTIGALAVLRPLVKDSSGHVGFVTGEDANRVLLLGGNQQDRVCEEKFKKADVVQYRWLEWR